MSLPFIEVVFQNLILADLLIADLSYSRPNVMYELGFADGRGKPVILIAQDSTTNGSLIYAASRSLVYDGSRLDTSFKQKLVTQIVEAIRNPKQFSYPLSQHQKEQERKPTVFVSYSHADKDCLSRLRVHLRPLERNDQLELWDDTRIMAGTKWHEEIERALDRAAIAVLLVSADYLASDFVVDNELPPLLRAAEEKGTTILPIILRPCRFVRDEHLSIFQAINDPRNPLLSLPASEQEELYAKLAERIESELKASV